MTKVFLLTAVSALALTGCATALERSTQTVYFQAVGATEVSCSVDTGKLKYKVNLPQKAEITKSRLPIHLTCLAAGNRKKEMLVASEVSGWTFGNVATGVVPGAAWDAASGAMFKYPDIIIVDFTDTIAVGDNLPLYHAVDGLDPKYAAGSVENLGPNTLKLPGDDATALRHKMSYLQRERDDAVVLEKSERRQNLEGGWEGDKGRVTTMGGSGSVYVPPRFEPSVDMPAASPPVNAAPAPGTPPGKAMPTPLFPSTTSF
jgi:hypothetical protein